MSNGVGRWFLTEHSGGSLTINYEIVGYVVGGGGGGGGGYDQMSIHCTGKSTKQWWVDKRKVGERSHLSFFNAFQQTIGLD